MNYYFITSSDLSEAQKKFSDTLQRFEFNCIEGEQTEDEKVIGTFLVSGCLYGAIS